MNLPAGAKILIVDDLLPMRTALRQALLKLGFENVLECGDGTEALSALENEDIALIISDWQMEPMDGLGLLRAIRSDLRLGQLPFILVSAEAGSSLREHARAAGASLVLSKPFGAETLRTALDTLAT